MFEELVIGAALLAMNKLTPSLAYKVAMLLEAQRIKILEKGIGCSVCEYPMRVWINRIPFCDACGREELGDSFPEGWKNIITGPHSF